MTDHRAPGTIGWVELTTVDADAAGAFYRELLGWKVEHTATPAGTYHVGWVGGAETAGIMEAPDAPPAWTPYVRVARLETTIATIEQLGGKATAPPAAIPGDTRIAMATDPTGAAFGLFQGPPERGLHIRTDPGALCWVEVLTRDRPATEDFYASVFGWSPDTAPIGDTDYTTFKLGKLHVAGMLPMPSLVPKEAPSHWLPYFDVRSCEAAADDAAWLGARVAAPPTTVGPGTFAVVEDLHGAVFALFETRFGG